MAERLTEHTTRNGIARMVIKPYIEMSKEFQPIADKLCKLEDIMEKYNIESVESLEVLVKNITDCEKSCKSLLNPLKQDRDSWKKACELAVRKLNCWDNLPTADCFYQQAKEK